ncbi:MAG: multiple antibiotic resistance (MarC)-related protein [Phycisphaerales bacterium]|nr:multiple antibiotic resistance (MarC)-related protein [Phycisphaerales bacterium]
MGRTAGPPRGGGGDRRRGKVVGMDLAAQFFQAFIPLFVAIDPVGLVPIFLAVTAGVGAERRRRVSCEAVGVAAAISLGFMFVGQALFAFLGVRDYDFMIGGGVLLLVLAVLDLVMHGKPAVEEADLVGIVPLAMPMIAGPATLTTVLVLRGRYGASWTALGLSANLLLLLGVLLMSGRIARLAGPAAMRALSKLVMILLAAIAVSFIRTGVERAMGR